MTLRTIAGLAAILLLASPLAAQPTDNPITAAYPDQYSWTGAIDWANVTTFSGDATGATPNDAVLATLMDTVSGDGGGVIYFPAGDYRFDLDIELRSGVVLRGEAPTGVTNATEEGYDPPTNFIFPQFDRVTIDVLDRRVVDTTFNSLTERSAYFKRITAQDPLTVERAGVVNIDLNRAGIHLVEYVDGSNFYFVTGNRNGHLGRDLIVYGNRINNTTFPQGGYPNESQASWQIVPFRGHAKIDVIARANVIVANNRISDLHYADEVLGDSAAANLVDTFYLPTFGPETFRDGEGQPMGFGNIRGVFVSAIPFRYSEGYGIRVNHGVTGSSPQFTDPVEEPSRFRSGVVVRDNWLYNITRVGYMVGGDGAEVIGNVKRDDPLKILYLSPDKNRFAAFRFYENRGIDATGWNLIIEDNDLEVFRGDILGAGTSFSDDGGGILLQTVTGGTNLVNWTIRNNFISGAADIAILENWRINGLTIEGNTINVSQELRPARPDAIFVQGNGQTIPGALRNVTVSNNTIFVSGDVTQTPSIQLFGQLLPENVRVEGNRTGGSIVVNNYAPVGGNPLDTNNPYLVVLNNTLADGTGAANLIAAPIAAEINSFPTENEVDPQPTVEFLEPTAEVDFSTLVGTEIDVRVRVNYGKSLLEARSFAETVFFYDGLGIPPEATTDIDRTSLPRTELAINFAQSTNDFEIFEGTYTVPANWKDALFVAEVTMVGQDVTFGDPLAGPSPLTYVDRFWSIYRPFVDDDFGNGNGGGADPVVPTIATGTAAGGTGLSFSWPVQDDVTYRILSTDDLTLPLSSWNVETITIETTNGTASAEVPFATDASKFVVLEVSSGS